MYKSGLSRSILDLAALLLMALETAATALVAIGYAIYALVDRQFSGLGVSLAAVAAIMAFGIGAFTWGFATHKRFALGGALTWQLMQASVGVWMVTTRPVVGAALIATAAVVTVAVVRRQSAYGKDGPPLSS